MNKVHLVSCIIYEQQATNDQIYDDRQQLVNTGWYLNIYEGVVGRLHRNDHKIKAGDFVQTYKSFIYFSIMKLFFLYLNMNVNWQKNVFYFIEIHQNFKSSRGETSAVFVSNFISNIIIRHICPHLCIKCRWTLFII